MPVLLHQIPPAPSLEASTFPIMSSKKSISCTKSIGIFPRRDNMILKSCRVSCNRIFDCSFIIFTFFAIALLIGVKSQFAYSIASGAWYRLPFNFSSCLCSIYPLHKYFLIYFLIFFNFCARELHCSCNSIEKLSDYFFFIISLL